MSRRSKSLHVSALNESVGYGFQVAGRYAATAHSGPKRAHAVLEGSVLRPALRVSLREAEVGALDEHAENRDEIERHHHEACDQGNDHEWPRLRDSAEQAEGGNSYRAGPATAKECALRVASA